MSYADKEIACRECGGRFVFTAGEQEFYASKGFTNEPTRCPAQRRARKHGAPLPSGPCPHDASGAGVVAPVTADRGEVRPLRGGPQRSPRPPYTGRMPNDPVPARVLRIDPAGRFLFARVEPEGFDVYVHHSLFRDAGIREGDQVRLLVGADHRRLLPVAALAGAIFLIWVDVLARVVVAPQELPIGIITALLGAPFFIWLMRRTSGALGGGR